jgi:hypothetical protein
MKGRWPASPSFDEEEGKATLSTSYRTHIISTARISPIPVCKAELVFSGF